MMKQKQFNYKDCLTNEALFQQTNESQFDIINQAIKIAEYNVRSGKAFEDGIDNVAYDVLTRLADEGVCSISNEDASE